MNFSFTIKYTTNAQFSPNSSLISICKNDQLMIYNLVNFKLFQKFQFQNNITLFEWSPDSEYILVYIAKNSLVEVKSLTNPDWYCYFTEANLNISYVKWCPDSRKILSVPDIPFKLTIYSLTDKNNVYLNYPKFIDERCFLFSSNLFFCVVPERKEIHEYIGIYSLNNFELINHFMVITFDMQNVIISKDDINIIIIDSQIENKVYIYSIIGNLIRVIDYRGSAYCLNANIVKMTPNGNLFIIGLSDYNIKIYEYMQWNLVGCINHIYASYNNQKKKYLILKEEEVINDKGEKSYKFSECNSISNNITSINYKSGNLGNKSLESQGIKQIEVSADSKYCAFKNSQNKNVLWIWRLDELMLAYVIIYIKKIRDFKWYPDEKKTNVLFVITESSKLYIFTPEDISIIDIPAEGFNPYKMQWSNNGNSLILYDTNNILLSFIDSSSI